MKLRSRAGKMDILILAGIIAAWIVLQMWVLPRFGVQT